MSFSKDKPARVLIVDDHAIVRYGMGALLADADDLELCGEAATIDEALQALHDLQPDVIVVDLILQDESGFDLIRRIREAESQRSEVGDQRSEVGGQRSEVGGRKSGATPPASRTPHPASPIPILVLSMHGEGSHAPRALKAGAQGYVMKEEADETLVDALRTVLAGGEHLSDAVRDKQRRAGDEAPADGIDALTAREKEIFACVGRGLTTRQIADQFELSPRTVEVHRAGIKKKLGCDTAAQMVRAAVQWLESGAA